MTDKHNTDSNECWCNPTIEDYTIERIPGPNRELSDDERITIREDESK